MWAVLPYAVLWVIWTVRNDLCFREGGLADQTVVSRVKGCIWAWINMERNCRTLKETLTFRDLRCRWVELFQE
ncbi:hypothetical protein FRX31_003230 [Thalictrum thalictroides]|uniref:Secreted protein n=1 Tax=Thalictrum thalictroides TaxID=46969 RepID=A0A7J6XBL0_THATH|nr:hypothetical protein FRX31_003230 [Thalictrum thalictroides]